MFKLPPAVTLVDENGSPIRELDPTDPANWPNWTDNHFWSTPPDDVASLEADEMDRLLNDDDAPRPAEADQLWAQMMVEASLPPVCGGAPTPFVPSPQDWADYYANRGD
jgi:hypothetical protein